MARNRDIEETDQPRKSAKKKKKKRCGCCCGCMIIVCILMIVTVVGGGIGANIWMESNLKYGIFDVFDVVGSALTSDEGNIVGRDRAPTEQDKLDLFKSMNDALFLNDGVLTEQTFIDLFEEISGDKGALASAIKRADGSDPDPTSPGDTPPSEASGDDLSKIFEELIGKILVKENFNITNLAAFDYDDPSSTAGKARITDRQIAALLNSILPMTIDALGKDMGSMPSDVLKNIRIAELTIEQESSSDVLTTFVKLTVKLDTAHLTTYLYNDTLKDIPHMLKLSQLLLELMLPKTLYLSVRLPVSGEGDASIGINNLTIDKFAKLSEMLASTAEFANKTFGTDLDINLQNIANDVKDIVQPTLETLKAVIDFESFVDGKVEMDLFDIVLSSANLGEDITSKDIILTMKGLIATEFDTSTPKEDEWNPFRDWYGDDIDNLEYLPNAVDTDDMFSFKQAFVDEIANKYALDLTSGTPDDPSDDITFDDLMAMFGIGTGDSSKTTDDLIEMFDPLLLKEKLKEAYSDDLCVNITDQMMAAIIDSMFDDLLGGDEALGGMNMRLEQLILLVREVEKTVPPVDGEGDPTVVKADHNFVIMTISLDVASMLGEDNAIIAMMQNLLPEKMYLTMEVDITLGLTEQEREEVRVRFNGLTYEETDIIFNLLSSFGGDALNKDSLTGEISNQLNTVFDNMASIINISLEKSRIQMPNLFDTLAIQFFGDSDLTGQDVHEILGILGANDGKDIDQLKTTASNLDNFYDSLEQNYYVNINLDEGDDDIAPLMDGSLLGEFTMSNFNLDGANGLFYDDRLSEEPVILSDTELAYIMTNQMSGQGYGDIYKNFLNILNLTIEIDENGDRIMTIEIAIEMDVLFDDGKSSGSDQFANLFGSEGTFFILKFVTNLDDNDNWYNSNATTGEYWNADSVGSKPAEYNDQFAWTEVTINDMNPTQLANFQKIINSAVGENAFNLQLRAMDIGRVLHDQIGDLGNSIKGGIEFVSADPDDPASRGGIKLPSFYTMLAEMLGVSNDSNQYGATKQEFHQNLRGALQGLYVQKAEGSSPSNFDLDVTKFNPIISGASTLETEIQDAKQDIIDNPFNYISAGSSVSGKTKSIDYTIMIDTSPVLNIGDIYLTSSDQIYGKYVETKLTNLGEMTQFVVLASDDPADSGSSAELAQWLEGYKPLVEYDDTSGRRDPDSNNELSYAIVTIKTEFTATAGEEIKGMMPDYIYMTAVIAFESGADGSSVVDSYLRMNSLSKVEQDLLIAIMGIDSGEMNSKISNVVDTAIANVTGCAKLPVDSELRQDSQNNAAPWDGVGVVTFKYDTSSTVSP